MQHFKTRPYIASADVDPDEHSIADQFAQIMGRVRLEYDLEPALWAVAQNVFQALRAKEEHWSSQQLQMPGIALM